MSEGGLRAAGAQEPECTRQYMGIPWPAKRYIHVPGLILAPPVRKILIESGRARALQSSGRMTPVKPDG
jgi:hypothetical protein